MYFCFLGPFLLPIAPAEINTVITNKNETVTLINDGEINILKQPGLTEINFDFLVPSQKYPFATYWIPQLLFLEMLELLKTSQKPFQFIVTRMNGLNVLHFTNVKVSLESYTIKESADNGMDLIVSISLKQYKEYETKKLIMNNGVASISKIRG